MAEKKDPLKARISLLEMGEAKGKLKPEHAAELAHYRQSGRSKAPAGTTLETPKARDDARKAMGIIERIIPALNRVEHLQRTTLGGTGLGGLKEYNPFSQANREYDAAAAQLKTLVRPATRTPGEGSTSDFESKLAIAALPDRWALDGSNNEAIRGLRSLINSSRKQYQTQLGQRSSLRAAPPSRRQAPAPSQGWTVTRKK